MASTLRVIGKAMTYRDCLARQVEATATPPAGMRDKWRPRLARGETLTEAESLALLADYGVPTIPFAMVDDLAGALVAAEKFGGAVVIKTAMPGILHKSDVGGVHLNLHDATAVKAAYLDMAARLGPQALVMPMASKGIELAFGGVIDAQFGALAMISAGGVLIEILDDRQVSLAPIDRTTAGRQLKGLRVSRLLDGYRGAPAVDRGAIAAAYSHFSVMLHDLGDLIAECDLNPVIATADGCLAVDALIVPRR
jgi:acyl-CoA synthetase (NDP forming)